MERIFELLFWQSKLCMYLMIFATSYFLSSYLFIYSDFVSILAYFQIKQNIYIVDSSTQFYHTNVYTTVYISTILLLFHFVMNEKSTKQLNGFNLIFLFNQLTIFAYFDFLVVIVLINTFLLLSCPNTFLKV